MKPLRQHTAFLIEEVRLLSEHVLEKLVMSDNEVTVFSVFVILLHMMIPCKLPYR
jgi:hypothetical protein